MPTEPEKGRAGKHRIKMHYIRARRQLFQIKHAYCMAPGTTTRSVKYLRNIPRSTPCNGHTKKSLFGRKQSVVSPLSSTTESRKPPSWSMMIPFPRKKDLKSKSAKSDTEDVGNTYGIDHLNIGEDKHDSDDSE